MLLIFRENNYKQYLLTKFFDSLSNQLEFHFIIIIRKKEFYLLQYSYTKYEQSSVL